MTEYFLRRKANPKLPNVTIGILTEGVQFLAHTLEDPIREIPGEPVESWKIAGETAIPAGRYQVIINKSQRFQRDLPLLIGVPGFSGIRIHAGNTAADTEGCILVGRKVSADTILESRWALTEVMLSLEDALQQGECWLTISNP